MKLTNKELNEELNRLNSLANKRLKRLKKQGIKSPALKNVPDKFTNKGKTRAEKLKDYHRVSKFVNAETSTLRGVKKTYDKILHNTGLDEVKCIGRHWPKRHGQRWDSPQYYKENTWWLPKKYTLFYTFMRPLWQKK